MKSNKVTLENRQKRVIACNRCLSLATLVVLVVHVDLQSTFFIGQWVGHSVLVTNFEACKLDLF